MRFRFLVLLVWGWCWASYSAAREAPSAPVFRDTFLLHTAKEADISESYRYYTEPFSVPAHPEQAEAQWRAGKFRPGPWHKPLNLGRMHQRVWIRLLVRNAEPQRQRYLWSIYNFTDSAALYSRRPGESTFTRLGTSSSWLPAAARLFPARSLSFPFSMEPGETAVLYLRADVHTGGIYLPLYIETVEHFLAWEMLFPFDWHWVWLLGFYLSSALFNLVLFAFLRDRIHLWYVAYVVCVTLFLMMEDGLDSLLLPAGLYRLLWSVGQYNFMLLAGAAGICVMQLFLRLRSGMRQLYRAGNWLAGGAVGFVVAYAAVFPWAVQHRLAVVELLNTARELLMLVVFGYGWVVLASTLRTRRRRRLSALYALTYLFFVVGLSIFWLNHLGVSSYNPLYPNTLAWGLFFELLILSALLTGRFRHTLHQNSQLRIRELQQRNAMGRRLIAAQDAEREQLARELHDAMGPNLAALHMAWQSEAVRDALAAAPKALPLGQLTEEILGQLYQQVRQLSHELLPAEPGTNRLTGSVKALCDTLNLHGTPQVHTRIDTDLDELPQVVQSAAYRIVAELVNNAVRHAQATQVRVHLHHHPALLEICVEDDGRGFGRGEDAPVTGIGLRGVRTRAAYLGGSVTIEAPGRGTRVVVRLPV